MLCVLEQLSHPLGPSWQMTNGECKGDGKISFLAIREMVGRGSCMYNQLNVILMLYTYNLIQYWPKYKSNFTRNPFVFAERLGSFYKSA